MDNFLIGVFLGLFIGMFLGIVIMSILIVARDSDNDNFKE